MALAAGVRLGHFEVLAPLGAGGMGEVYRARDLNLGREVALKVLPADFAHDRDRLSRFEREACAAAALNHPNILMVFEVGEQDGTPFVASELLSGETLREALTPGLTLRQTLDYTTQIANGLAAAHEKGVIHRDLKPENLFITSDGRIKILDFGLAKLISEGDDSSPETRSGLTIPGTILGTAGYMAPEQVRGQSVDPRADIFSLGAVLYEMVGGRRAFWAETMAETLTAILKEDPPDLSDVVPAIPSGVVRVLRRCLEKRREDRFQSARDVAFALEVGAGPEQVARPATRSASRWALLTAGAAAAGFLGGVLLSRLGSTSPITPTLKRVTIDTPASARLSSDIYVPFALAPDGRTLAYVTTQPENLFLRRLDSFEVKQLEGTEGANDPFFSPDGQWVGFWTTGTIKKVPAAGGPAETLCRAEDMLGASWGEDGSIAFSPRAGEALFVVSANGGTPRPLTKLDSTRHEIQHAFPQMIRGGRAVLFTATVRSNSDPYSIEVQDIATGERRTVVPAARYGRYLPTGHLVYVRGRTAFAARVDPGTLRLVGTPVAIDENIASGMAGEALLSVATDGTLLFVPYVPPADRSLVWVNRTGAATDLGLPPRPYQYPRIAPDGRRVAVSIPEPGRQDIWIYTVERATFERLTFDRAAALGFYQHIFTPDGARLTYAVDSPGGFALVSQPLDGSGPAEELVTWPRRVGPLSWLGDGRTLFLNELGSTTSGDILVMHPGAQPPVTPIVQEPGNQWGAFASPDGRYVAYVSDETGRFEIYVRPYPGIGPKRQLTTEGGGEPVWSRDGRELFYRRDERLMSIPVATASLFEAGRPRVLFEGRFVKGAPGLPAFDVSPSGQFLMMKGEAEEPPRELRAVFNWLEELRPLAPQTP